MLKAANKSCVQLQDRTSAAAAAEKMFSQPSQVETLTGATGVGGGLNLTPQESSVHLQGCCHDIFKCFRVKHCRLGGKKNNNNMLVTSARNCVNVKTGRGFMTGIQVDIANT